MTASARFRIGKSSVSASGPWTWADYDTTIDATASDYIKCEFETLAGIDTAAFTIPSADEDTLAAGVPTVTNDAPTRTATFQLGSSAACYIVRGTANPNSADAVYTELAIHILTASGKRLMALDETDQSDRTYYYLAKLNDIIRYGSSLPSGSAGQYLVYNSGWTATDYVLAAATSCDTSNFDKILGAVDSDTQTALETLDEAVASCCSGSSSSVTSLETVFCTEASTRTSEVNSIDDRVSTVDSTTTSADASLTTRVSTEESTSTSVTTSLATARSSAVASLETRESTSESNIISLETRTSTVESVDTSLETRISTEESVRASADASIVALTGGLDIYNQRVGQYALTATSADVTDGTNTLTITPASGTYIVLATCALDQSSGDGFEIRLCKDTATWVELTLTAWDGYGNDESIWSAQEVITCNGSNVIHVQANYTNSNGAYVQDGTLTLIPINSVTGTTVPGVA